MRSCHRADTLPFQIRGVWNVRDSKVHVDKSSKGFEWLRKVPGLGAACPHTTDSRVARSRRGLRPLIVTDAFEDHTCAVCRSMEQVWLEQAERGRRVR